MLVCREGGVEIGLRWCTGACFPVVTVGSFAAANSSTPICIHVSQTKGRNRLRIEIG